MQQLCQLLSFAAIAVFATSVWAADEHTEKQAFLDPAQAGPDFLIQGEYAGTIGAGSMGAQVIALGDGEFRAVLYPVGLPGAGWEEKTKVFLKGKTEGDKTNFTGKNFTGSIQNDSFTGVAEDDVKFDLKKIERKSPTLEAKPPEGAIVLFDGSNVDAFVDGKLEEEHLLGVGTKTKQEFRDFTLHLEFRLPYMPDARGQARGNSGMYLLDQYECQVLDSFGLRGLDNECGGIYKASKPAVNMCFPPLSWQTYDVDFTAARFDDAGVKTTNAFVTIKLNGVVIHENLELKTATPGGGRNDERPGALFLQDHGDPVRYRNIWILEK